MEDWQNRVYARYSTARSQSLPPGSLQDVRRQSWRYRQVIRRFFPPDRQARILDLGCGHGAFLHAMHESGYARAVGVDHSPEQVGCARSLGIDGVELGDAFDKLASLEADSFDVVIAWDLLEHLSMQRVFDLADEVIRVLRTGGKWIVHCPCGNSPFVGRTLYKDLTHERAFTENSASQLTMTAGFSSVEFAQDGPVVHGAVSLIRWVLWAVLRSGLRLWLAAETGNWRPALVLTQNFLFVGVK